MQSHRQSLVGGATTSITIHIIPLLAPILRAFYLGSEKLLLRKIPWHDANQVKIGRSRVVQDVLVCHTKGAMGSLVMMARMKCLANANMHIVGMRITLRGNRDEGA